jgi:hypothetical protein
MKIVSGSACSKARFFCSLTRERAHAVLGAQDEADAMRQRRPQDRLMDEVGRTDLVGVRDGLGIIVAVTMMIGTSNPGRMARNLAQMSKPLLPGNSTSSRTRSGFSFSKSSSLLGVAGGWRMKPACSSVSAREQCEDRIVIDDQYAAAG